MIALSSFVLSLSVIVTFVATDALVAFVTVTPAITVFNGVPPIVMASASNVPSISTSPLISSDVASISPLALNVTPSSPEARNIIWSSVPNFIWLSASLPTTKELCKIDVIVVCRGVIAISFALDVIPSPPTTSNVLPDLVNPSPAVIWPAPENCANVSDVVPTVILSLVVNTNPESEFTVPSSIKVNAPAVTSESSLKSSALDHAPDLHK